MLTRWSDFNRLFGLQELERTFSLFDELRRRSESAFGRAQLPLMNVSEHGDHLEVTAEVPGIPADELSITLENDVLSLRGKRKWAAPEGYDVHMRERRDLSFTQSISLPIPVESEKTMASVKDGILTVVLHKAEAAKPRRITVSNA